MPQRLTWPDAAAVIAFVLATVVVIWLFTRID
jgi:hypothetical protein